MKLSERMRQWIHLCHPTTWPPSIQRQYEWNYLVLDLAERVESIDEQVQQEARYVRKEVEQFATRLRELQARIADLVLNERNEKLQAAVDAVVRELQATWRFGTPEAHLRELRFLVRKLLLPLATKEIQDAEVE